jgi:hypothetical protein
MDFLLYFYITLCTWLEVSMIQRLLFYKDSNKTKYLNYEIKNEIYMLTNYYRTISQLYSLFDICNYGECQKKPKQFKIVPPPLMFYQNRHRIYEYCLLNITFKKTITSARLHQSI